LFITHNLGVVASIADSVLVMEQGSLCESGTVTEVLTMPSHDYTRRLLSAAPSLPEAAVG
jgi:peptide/nickel transport system ATP-binding protein